MKAKLRRSGDFKRVYQEGKRYQSSLITAFVLVNDQANHRLGVTVSRKISATAVGRNRAKRLLRETFRLKRGSFGSLKKNYDWVLNGRQALLSVKISEPLEEFGKIIKRVAADEGNLPRSDQYDSEVSSNSIT